MLVSSQILKKEATSSSETSVRLSTDYMALYPQKTEHFITTAVRTSNPTQE
jgi:hypothetical protein